MGVINNMVDMSLRAGFSMKYSEKCLEESSIIFFIA